MAITKKEDSLLVRLIFAPVLIVTAVLCLWENEGRFDFYKAAEQSLAISSSDIVTTKPEAAISVTGSNHPSPVFDEYVGNVEGYHKIVRITEIYSWKKTTSKKSDKWDLGWHSSMQDNTRNRGLVKTLANASHYPDQYKIDSLLVSPQKIHFVDSTVSLATNTMVLTEQGKKLGLSQAQNGSDQGYLYRHQSQNNVPQLGDERVSYEGIPVEQTVTYFGKIENNQGVAKQYESKTSFISALIFDDAILHHLVNGPRPVALEKIKAYLSMLKWIVRAAGLLAIFFGFYMVIEKFVHILLDLPLIGSIVNFGVWSISLVMALAIGGTTILLSMLYNNPQVTLPLIAGLAFMIYYFKKNQKKTKANAQEFLQSNCPGPATLEFETQRRENTFLTLVKLALMENGLSTKENRFLVSWGKKQGLSEETMTQLFQRGKNTCNVPLAITMDDLYLMTSLAMCDGLLSAKELAHLNSIGRQINLGPEQVKNIIHAVKNGKSPALDVKKVA